MDAKDAARPKAPDETAEARAAAASKSINDEDGGDDVVDEDVEVVAVDAEAARAAADEDRRPPFPPDALFCWSLPRLAFAARASAITFCPSIGSVACRCCASLNASESFSALDVAADRSGRLVLPEPLAVEADAAPADNAVLADEAATGLITPLALVLLLILLRRLEANDVDETDDTTDAAGAAGAGGGGGWRAAAAGTSTGIANGF